MLQQAQTPRITLMLGIVLLLTSFALFTSCYKYITPPSEPGNQLDESPGTIGDNVTANHKLYNDSDTGEWYSMTQFADNNQGSIGQAKLLAAQDLVSYINKQKFNIPGETQFDVQNYFSVRVVTNYASASETKYKVTLYNVDAPSMPPVSFVIDNIEALGKKSTTLSDEKANLVDPTLFVGYLATHIVMLCQGPEKILQDAQACRETAREACDALGVMEAYLEVRFSLGYGCGGNKCNYECNVHDQGRWGFY